MRRRVLLVDAGIALVLAILVIALSPGLAVVGLVALAVLLLCGLSFGVDRLRRRRTPDNPVAELRASRRRRSYDARSGRRPERRSDRRRADPRRSRR